MPSTCRCSRAGRPVDLRCPPEHAGGEALHREDPQQLVEGLADRPGMRVRAEISNALLRSPHDHGPRELLVQRHGQVRVALVVAIADVEARVELLDPGVLELECFDLGTYHGPLDLGGAGDHRQGARMERGEVLEVRAEPGSQGLLPCRHREDPAVHVAEPVDARLVWHGPGRRAIRGRVRHNPQPWRRTLPALEVVRRASRVRSARPGRPRRRRLRPAVAPAPGRRRPSRPRWSTGCRGRGI